MFCSDSNVDHNRHVYLAEFSFEILRRLYSKTTNRRDVYRFRTINVLICSSQIFTVSVLVCAIIVLVGLLALSAVLAYFSITKVR